MHWDLQSIKFFFHLKETERPVWNNYKLNLGMKKSDEIWFKKSQMLIPYNLEYLTTPYQIVWKFLKLKKKAIKFWNDKKSECSVCQSVFWMKYKPPQPAFACSKLTTVTLVLGVRGWDWRHQNVVNDDILVSLMLALSITWTFL